jgi:uncharacterized protein (TIGR00730 family)
MTPPEHKPWPCKAYKNLDFLNSDAARNIRVLCEMTEPGLRLKEAGVDATIVLFGSARIRPLEEAEKARTAARSIIEDPDHPTADERRHLQRAERAVAAAPFYQAAVELSERLSNWSTDRERAGDGRYMICSGGGPGIMEAANLGARQAGEDSIGLGISLPFEQGINSFVPEHLQFEFHYFFVRKYWFVLMAKALVAFPGGFGTLDELFETLTLVQTRKIEDAPPIVLYGRAFWNEVVNFDALVKWGTISAEDLDLIHIVDSVDEAYDIITGALTTPGKKS